MKFRALSTVVHIPTCRTALIPPAGHQQGRDQGYPPSGQGRDRSGGEQHTIAMFNMYVNCRTTSRDHMSRFVEILNVLAARFRWIPSRIS